MYNFYVEIEKKSKPRGLLYIILADPFAFVRVEEHNAAAVKQTNPYKP